MKYYWQAIKECFCFRGRMGRKEYWMFQLVNLIICIALFALLALVNTRFSVKLFYIKDFFRIYGAFVGLANYSSCIKRLHDVGKSGWFILLAFIPIIGQIWLLILLAKETELVENKYGQISSDEKIDLDLILNNNKLNILLIFLLLLSDIFNSIYRIIIIFISAKLHDINLIDVIIICHNILFFVLNCISFIVLIIILVNKLKKNSDKKEVSLNIISLSLFIINIIGDIILGILLRFSSFDKEKMINILKIADKCTVLNTILIIIISLVNINRNIDKNINKSKKISLEKELILED